MSQVLMGNRLQDGLRDVGRNWIWPLVFGILFVVAGLLAIFLPGLSLRVIAILFGAQLIANAIFLFFGAFAVSIESGWLRALTAMLAVISFVVGIYVVGHPLVGLLLLALVLGVYWMIHGVVHLFVAIGQTEARGRGWTMASGILSIIAGAVVLLFPGISLLALVLVLGIWLIIYGVILIVSAFGARTAPRVRAERSGLSPT
jgi:uncharacterized membrane protein HdeD (DUF308 family)